MKYPYIGNWKTIKATVMFTSPNSGFEIEGENKYMNNWSECGYENITAEYLANTYGEVKSKAHAEFIVKLATENNIKVRYASFRDGIKSFEVSNGVLYLYCLKVSQLSVSDKKQITIPLPPECEGVDDKKPLKVLSGGRVYTFNEVTGGYDYNIPELCYAEGRALDKLKEADDYKVISFIGADEWPKVGDTVTWGTKAINGEIKGIDGELAWIRNDHGNHNTVHISNLEKPKTAEQELNEELYGLCLTHCDSKFQASEISRKLMNDYNITKKPQ